MRGTTFLWHAAGRPAPVETDGTPIHARRAVVDSGAICAACGEPAAYLLGDAISDKFTTVHNDHRAWPYGGAALCAGCVWCCKAIALRCAPFFATERGIWFVGSMPIKGLPKSRPLLLDALLNPPAPPFVVGIPRTGMEHGGEDMLERCCFAPPTDKASLALIKRLRAQSAEVQTALVMATPVGVEDANRMAARAVATMTFPSACNQARGAVLARARGAWDQWVIAAGDAPREPWWRFAVWPAIKLQSKHTALYAKVAMSRERYPVQVDDAQDFVLDVALWRKMREVVTTILVDMRAQGVGAREATDAVLYLRRPSGYRCTARRWAEVVMALRPHYEAPWWPIFVGLVPMPALTKTARVTVAP